MGSFSTALSGLTANTTALSVVGDDLANMNTQGFKCEPVQFEDAMAQATQSLQIGDGVGATLPVATSRKARSRPPAGRWTRRFRATAFSSRRIASGPPRIRGTAVSL